MSRSSWIICHHAPELSAPDITVVSRGCHYATSVDHQTRSVYADVNCRYYFASVYIRPGGPKQRLRMNKKFAPTISRMFMCITLRIHYYNKFTECWICKNMSYVHKFEDFHPS